MSAGVLPVYVATTGRGRGAIWQGAPPAIEPFRAADLLFLDVGEKLDQQAVIRALVGADVVLVGTLDQKFAAAAWRVHAGRAPWIDGCAPKSWRPYMHEAFDGRRNRTVEGWTPEEVRRVRELEEAADRRLADLVAAYRARGVMPFTKGDPELLRIGGIEKAIRRLSVEAVVRRFGPRWCEADRANGDLFARMAAAAKGSEHFDVLGIAPTSDAAAIRAAWKRKALETHPDRGGSAEAFRKAKAAYDAIARAL